MVWVPENAQYLLGGIPDSVLLLTVSVVYLIIVNKISKKVGK